MMLGFVGDRNVAPGEQYTLRNFELTSSIYDATKAEAIEFSVTCYFGSGRAVGKYDCSKYRFLC